MEIKLIQNLGRTLGGCAKTVLGITLCPICNRQMCIEVAKTGDSVNSAWFIYHEKLGGGYCPGSCVNAKKLQTMAKMIKVIQDLGFVIADIINYDPAGEVQRVIAYLPGKACLLVANFKDGKFVSASMEGQLRYGTKIQSKDFCEEWTNHNKNTIMLCSSTQAILPPKVGAVNVNLQGKFFWTSKCQEWFEVLKDFLHRRKEDVSEKFRHPYNSIQHARRFVKHSLVDKNAYNFIIAGEINQRTVDKLPKKMFDYGVYINTTPQ